MKLPPRTADKLQPLDRCCFKMLKQHWEGSITSWADNHKIQTLSKQNFLDRVSDVYDQCLTPDLIKKAFRKCGIYPLDRYTYPMSEFAPNLLGLNQRESRRLYVVSRTFFQYTVVRKIY